MPVQCCPAKKTICKLKIIKTQFITAGTRSSPLNCYLLISFFVFIIFCFYASILFLIIKLYLRFEFIKIIFLPNCLNNYFHLRQQANKIFRYRTVINLPIILRDNVKLRGPYLEDFRKEIDFMKTEDTETQKKTAGMAPLQRFVINSFSFISSRFFLCFCFYAFYRLLFFMPLFFISFLSL